MSERWGLGVSRSVLSVGDIYSELYLGDGHHLIGGMYGSLRVVRGRVMWRHV